jgi:dTMP kinase
MLIAIEGIDGSGKGTQTEMLRARALREGLSVAVFSFPQYGSNPFGRAVGKYLDGAYGRVEQVPPQLAALLYAGDRYVARNDLNAALTSHDLVVCDRYVPSNLAHQAAKLSEDVRPELIAWLSEIEYGVYKLPRPDVVVFYDMPVETAAEMILRKKRRHYTDRRTDIHEEDQHYLSECRNVYLALAASDAPRLWVNIQTTSTSGTIRRPEDIAEDTWVAIAPKLSTRQSVS